MTLAELQQQRAQRLEELSGLAKMSDADMTAEQRSKFDDLENEVRSINTDIDRQVRWNEMERLASAEPINLPEMRNYSVARAIMGSMNGTLDGVEREMHEELSRGRSEIRGVMIPTSELLGCREERVLTTTTPGGGPGSNIIATQLAPLDDRFRIALRVEGLGATVLRNLTGDLDLPNLKASGTVHWIADEGETTQSDPQFEKVAMSPKTVSAEYRVSRRMLLQSQQALEPILRNDLGTILAEGLDGVAIQGGGTNEPQGIIGATGVSQVTGGAFDSDITADQIAGLEGANVDGTLAFLTNSNVMQAVRKKKDADSRIIPVSELFHDQRVEVSNNVPADLGVGNDENALICGLWSNLVIGYWSAVDILVNPYHTDVASRGGALIHAFLDADVAVRHPEAFNWSQIT